VTGPHHDPVRRMESRREERDAADMVEMAVCEEEVRIETPTLVTQRLSERPEAGAAVEDQHMRPATNFYACRIAAVAQGLGSRAGDATAHAPEPYRKSIVARHAISQPHPAAVYLRHRSLCKAPSRI